jgi:hypothetical protein
MHEKKKSARRGRNRRRRKRTPVDILPTHHLLDVACKLGIPGARLACVALQG